MISLISSDGETFEIDDAVAGESLILKDCPDGRTIPLPNITSRILEKVIEYCRKHAEYKAAYGEVNNAWIHDIVVDDKDREMLCPGGRLDMNLVGPFIKERAPEHVKNLNKFDDDLVLQLDPKSLWDLMQAAGYLDIEGLHTLAFLKMV